MIRRHGVSRRTFAAAVVMVAAAAGGVFGLTLLDGDSEPVQGSEPPVLLLARSDLGEFAGLDSIAAASRVESVDKLQAVTQVAPALVVIDSSFAATLKSGDLAAIVGGGSAVIGLDVPLSQLNDVTGFEDELAAINPRFADQLQAQGRPSRPGPFYSLVWRTPADSNPAYWGRLQHLLSDGLFEAVISGYKLRVRGLIADGDRVVPLEQYGRE